MTPEERKHKKYLYDKDYREKNSTRIKENKRLYVIENKEEIYRRKKIRYPNKTPEEISRNISNSKLGSKNPMFGKYKEKVGSTAIHYWIISKLGQPDTCEKCGKSNLKGKQINWANKDHKYRRILSDWMRLCASCHKKYDWDNGTYPKKHPNRIDIFINCLRCNKKIRIMRYQVDKTKYCSRKCHYNH